MASWGLFNAPFERYREKLIGISITLNTHMVQCAGRMRTVPLHLLVLVLAMGTPGYTRHQGTQDTHTCCTLFILAALTALHVELHITENRVNAGCNVNAR